MIALGNELFQGFILETNHLKSWMVLRDRPQVLELMIDLQKQMVQPWEQIYCLFLTKGREDSFK